MKTFVRLIPATRYPGRFFCPRAPHGAGISLTPSGNGFAWWRPSARIDPRLSLELPPALAGLIFAKHPHADLSIWVKFPWRAPLEGALLLVFSLRRDDGTFLTLGWSPQAKSRSDAVEFLADCPLIDGAWSSDDQSFVDQRHGRLVSIDHYGAAGLTHFTESEAA